MSARKSTTAYHKAQPATEQQPLLTGEEVQLLSTRLAQMLYHDSDNIAALTLLFDHLSRLRSDPGMFATTISTIKTFLFVDTPESDKAQQRFEAAALKNRGKLLLFPFE